MTDHKSVEDNQTLKSLHSMSLSKHPQGEAEFNTLLAEGRSMTMEQAIQLALE